jgi:TRAP-type C4-dicarboxylate transport system permease small subunit
MSLLRTASVILETLSKYAVIACMVVMSVTVFAQIVLRYGVQYSLIWSEELSRYAMIWCIFLGSSIALKRGELVGVEMFINLLGRRTGRIVILAGNVAILAFLAVVLFQGIVLVQISFAYMAPTLPISMGVQYLSVPIWAGIMFVHVLFITAVEVAALRGEQQ